MSNIFIIMIKEAFLSTLYQAGVLAEETECAANTLFSTGVGSEPIDDHFNVSWWLLHHTRKDWSLSMTSDRDTLMHYDNCAHLTGGLSFLEE